MRHTLLCLGLLFLGLKGGLAQQEWVDFIVGRPDAFALEARRTVAKNWGIRYRSIMAGCVDCADTRSQSEQYAAQNQSYFAVLDQRYGTGWRDRFNQGVLKQQNALRQANQPDGGLWYEVITGRPNIAYFNTKKAIARSWGIPYEPLFVSQSLSGTARAELESQMAQSYEYERQLNQRLGDDWKAWIEEETRWTLAQKRTPQNGLWQDPIWGDPDRVYYEAKAAVAQRWNIAYQPLYLGTHRSKSDPPTPVHTNGQYFAILQQHYGEGWWQRFYLEVAKAYWSRRLAGE